MTSFTFPLSLADFLDQLPISSLSIDNPEQVEISGTGGGEILSAELAPQLWRGEITLGRMTRYEAAAAAALIDLVRGVGRSFMVTDTSLIGPSYDPDGEFIAGYSPVIDSLNADNARLKISGLPPSYVLSRGDRLSFAYGSSPVRYAMHRVVSLAVAADAAGLTDWIEVTSNLRTGVAIAAPLTLVRPSFKAKLVPKSSTVGRTRRTITEGASFKFIQTLR